MDHIHWTPDAHQQFLQDGFVVLQRQWTAGELTLLRNAFDRLQRQAQTLPASGKLHGSTFVIRRDGRPEGPAIERVVWCGAAEPDLIEPAVDPRILQPALAILGTDSCDQLVNQAHFKQPGDQVRFPLHQDAWNRRWGTALWRDRSRSGGYIQALLTIDDMRADNGPLQVVPGSHLAGPLIGLHRRAQLDHLVQQLNVQVVVAPPGSLILFGPFLIHGSEPNGSPHPRRVLVNGYALPSINRRKYPGAGHGVRRSINGSLTS